jgi:hypothetical protein
LLTAAAPALAAAAKLTLPWLALRARLLGLSRLSRLTLSFQE